MKFLRWLIPSKLRNKLFVAFFFFVFVPFLLLSMYVFNEVEKIIQDKISVQVHNDLNVVNKSLEDLTGTVMKTVILLEQDYGIESVFANPTAYEELERQSIIEDKLKSIYNSLFLNSPQIYITLLDFHGNVYTSFQPEKTLDYQKLTQEDWYQDVIESSEETHQWVTNDENYVHPDVTQSPYLLTLHAKLVNKHYNPFGAVRISIDYPQWFTGIMDDFDIQQDFFILSGNGKVVTKSDLNSQLHQDIQEQIFSQKQANGYSIEYNSNTMVNYNYIEKLDWYLVNNVNLNELFSETDQLKYRLFGIMLLITLFFILSTFVISTKVTKPLRYLQTKMTDFIHKNKNEVIVNNKASGEVKVLTESYNQLIHHINELINKLQVEERQRQALRFKMLIAQMNPHFLLNTLNTIKWIAIKDKNSYITEICVSLGKLLETSLNNEADLIPLKQEIELVNAYIYIQKFRYQDLFKVHADYSDEMQDILVPKLSVQMLVENAIQHGLYQKGSKGTIIIRAYAIEEGYCHIEVEDDGIGIEKAKMQKPHRQRQGIGIPNIKERLALLFDQRADLSMTNLSEGTLVRMKIPMMVTTAMMDERGNQHVDSIASGG